MNNVKTEMLIEMFKLQLEEDQKVQQEFGITYDDLIEEGKYLHALLDALGGISRESKPFWCWWKKDAEKFDRDKILEEFTDVTHFVLSCCLAINSRIERGSILSQSLLYGSTLENWKWNIIDESEGPRPYDETICKLLEYVASDIWGIDDRSLELHIECILSYWSNLIENECLDFETEVYLPFKESILQINNQPSS